MRHPGRELEGVRRLLVAGVDLVQGQMRKFDNEASALKFGEEMGERGHRLSA